MESRFGTDIHIYRENLGWTEFQSGYFTQNCLVCLFMTRLCYWYFYQIVLYSYQMEWNEECKQCQQADCTKLKAPSKDNKQKFQIWRYESWTECSFPQSYLVTWWWVCVRACIVIWWGRPEKVSGYLDELDTYKIYVSFFTNRHLKLINDPTAQKKAYIIQLCCMVW